MIPDPWAEERRRQRLVDYDLDTVCPACEQTHRIAYWAWSGVGLVAVMSRDCPPRPTVPHELVQSFRRALREHQ